MSPDRSIETNNQREGRLVSEQIRLAADLVKQALAVRETADFAAATAIHNTFGENWSCELRVRPAGEAYVVIDDTIIDESPEEFIATEVRVIGERGMEFLNRNNGQELRIKGFDFSIEPISVEGKNSN